MNVRALRDAVDRLPLGAVAVAGLAGAAGVAGSYAVAGFTPSFVAGPIAGFAARRLPGAVITFAIVVLGDLGKQLNVLGALAASVGLLGTAAAAGIAAGRRTDPRLPGPMAGGAAALLAGVVTRAPQASLAAGVGVGAVVLVAEGVSLVDAETDGRRRVLGSAAGALAVVTGGALLGERGGLSGAGVPSGTTVPDEEGGADDATSGRSVSALLAEAEEKSLDVEGLEGLVSEEFYQVDINATDPVLDAEEWSLTVTGAVGTETTYDYENITDLDSTNRFVSLRCVGEDLNGKKMDNAVWTAVPIMDVVEPAVPADECCVMLRAADGFFEEFPLAALRDGLLAYRMNGDPLPRGHGSPVRALIPGHWGEINVKWLTEIEVLREEQDGYWEQRGWHGTGPVNTVAKLHVVNDLEGGRKQVAGHAYAGTRGIERVEVSTDGGASWADATLSEPLPGEDVWRQWAYSYDPPEGEHEVVVRATDGTGTVQPSEKSESFPSGPTGWVSRTLGR
jgi:DMSO/TMAO reductase YedYZ molybdopterin-dependent catalytic subunit